MFSLPFPHFLYFLLPLSLCLLPPSIIHEVQRQERVWATSCRNSGRKPQDGRGGEQRPLETLLSCLSARWYDGRLCGEEGELKGGAWVCFVFFFFSSLSYHSKVHSHLFQWAELSRRSTLWIEKRGKGRHWSIRSCSTSHHQTEQISE